MKKVIVLLAPGFEEVEALTPVDYLRRAGVDVLTLATGTSLRNVEGARKITVVADMTLETYVSSCSELPDAIIIPGGMPGTTNIEKNIQAISLIEKMNEEKKLICAICAAPAYVLAKAKVLKERKWTCYPSSESNAQEYIQTHVSTEAVVHCENIITSRAPGTAEEFAMEIIKELCGEEKKEQIKRDTVQR